MVNFCLNEKERSLLKSLVGKRLLEVKHDPFDKFGGATVYGRVELFFEGIIVLIGYDYSPYPLFGSEDDDRPKFSLKAIGEEGAISALQDVDQVHESYNEIIEGVTLVEDAVKAEWSNKKDEVRTLIAILFKLPGYELGIQGDCMIPLLDLLRGEDLKKRLARPGEEFEGDSETRFEAKRFYVDL